MKLSKAHCFFCSPYDQELHSKIENEILLNEFKPGSLWGFRLHSRRQHYLQAVYIEKQILSEKITDPFGNITEYERVTYHQMDFQLSDCPPHILIFNPPRNYRKLLNQLAQFTDYTVAIKNRSVSLFDWVEILRKHDMNGIITKANINPIKYDLNTNGRLSLTSHIDLTDRIVKLLSGTSYLIKNLKITFTENLSIPDVELYSNGKVVFSRPVEIDTFMLFYDTFYKLTSKTEQKHSVGAT